MPDTISLVRNQLRGGTADAAKQLEAQPQTPEILRRRCLSPERMLYFFNGLFFFQYSRFLCILTCLECSFFFLFVI